MVTATLTPGRCCFWREFLSFKEISGRYDGPALETEVLEFWREHDVFQKTLDKYCARVGSAGTG